MENQPTTIRVRILVVLVCALGVVPSLAQQTETKQISGQVVDPVGAIISKANVFVRKNTFQSEEDVRLLGHTDIHGDFKLVLPEGGYDILVTSPGFASGFQTVPVWAGKKKKIEWKLRPLDCNFPGVNCDPVSVIR